MKISALLSIIFRLFLHPLSRQRIVVSLMNFIRWQLATRIFFAPVIVSWVDDAKFICSRGDTGLTGNIYNGLYEYEEMSFLLHYLKSDNIFVDVGANVGAYTILASGVVGAKSISFEPSSVSVSKLLDQIKVNDINDLVDIRSVAVGADIGEVQFTSGLDTTNHVINSLDDKRTEYVTVPVTRLDDELSTDFNYVIKIDVEGFELEVLKGAHKILASGCVLALIVELNGSGQRYGLLDIDVHKILTDFNYTAIKYSPSERVILPIATPNSSGNTIYVKSVVSAQGAVQIAPVRKLKIPMFDVSI